MMDSKSLLEGLCVIEGHGKRQFSQSARDARAVRQAERCHTRARLHKEAIAVPVIAPFELQDLLAAGRGSRYTRWRNCRLRPGTDEPHTFHGGKSFHETLRELDFRRGRGSEARPRPEGFRNRFHHLRMTMAGDPPSPGNHENH